MSEPSPARAALAEAIGARQAAERAVEAACVAENHAFDRMIDARSALEALRQLPADDIAQEYIDKLACDGEASVLELARPANDRAAQEQRLQAEIEGLRGLRADLQRATASRRQDVERADFSVRQRAADVIRELGAATCLIEGLAELQEQVAKRRAGLRFLKQHDMLSENAKERVAELLCADVSGDVRRSNPWVLALAALALSADAPLPLEQGDN